MYIDKLHLKNIRTFVDDTLEFIHPETEFKGPEASDEANAGRMPKPRLPNVNLLLGENGAGKTTVLQAIALASLGPAAPIAQLPVPRLVRTADESRISEATADIMARFKLHPSDAESAGDRELHLRLLRRSETEELQIGGNFPSQLNRDVSIEGLTQLQQTIRSKSKKLSKAILNPFLQEVKSAIGPPPDLSRLKVLLVSLEIVQRSVLEVWERVHDSQNPAFFCVAYGAMRRSDPGDLRSPSMRPAVRFLRAMRLQSIFEDGYCAVPLRHWLPTLREQHPKRHAEILNILNSLISDENCRLTDEERDGDLLFERHGLKLPLSELSDGYRAFIAWVADLLYHLSYACPREQSLLDCRGIVLVDEIDLHLHPRWQMKVVSTIANAFPKMQFIFTSHSPLIVGSVEWMNILTLQTDPAKNKTGIKRWPESVHGLDADQILLTKFFGLTTTRAGAKVSELEALREAALAGDRKAARALLRALSTGTEFQP